MCSSLSPTRESMSQSVTRDRGSSPLPKQHISVSSGTGTRTLARSPVSVVHLKHATHVAETRAAAAADTLPGASEVAEPEKCSDFGFRSVAFAEHW